MVRQRPSYMRRSHPRCPRCRRGHVITFGLASRAIMFQLGSIPPLRASASARTPALTTESRCVDLSKKGEFGLTRRVAHECSHKEVVL